MQRYFSLNTWNYICFPRMLCDLLLRLHCVNTFHFPDNIIDFSKPVLYIRVKRVSFKCYTILRRWFSLQVKDILKPEVMEEIVMLTQQKLLEQKGWRAVLTLTLLQNQDPTSQDTPRLLLVFLNPFIFMCATTDIFVCNKCISRTKCGFKYYAGKLFSCLERFNKAKVNV